MQLWFGTQSFMLAATQQLSVKYILQVESYSLMVSYSTTSQSFCVILGKRLFVLVCAFWYNSFGQQKVWVKKYEFFYFEKSANFRKMNISEGYFIQ